MRKPVSAVVLAALVLLAGCNGVVDAPESDPAETTTVPTTGDETTASTGPSTTVEPSQVVAFDELTDRRQAAFRDALQGEATFVPNSPAIDESAGYDFQHVTPFERHEYVRYDGALYRISVSLGDLYASYGLRASTASAPDDATVVTYDSLPESVRDEVRKALDVGRHQVPMGKWDALPESLQDARYVRYENHTYEMTYIVGDAWAKVLTVEKVE